MISKRNLVIVAALAAVALIVIYFWPGKWW
jgi:hypothetical protein